MITALILILTHILALVVGAVVLWPVAFHTVYRWVIKDSPDRFIDLMNLISDSLGARFTIEADEDVDKTSPE